jgi:transcription initiation factor IIE alpha subunit
MESLTDAQRTRGSVIAVPYFQCPGCGVRVHQSNSYTRPVTCPVCTKTLAATKSIIVDLDSWLADRVRNPEGRLHPNDPTGPHRHKPVVHNPQVR